MTKDVVIDTIGRVFVENKFRDEFNNDTVGTIEGVSGLDDKEKEFLKKMSTKIRECVSGLDTDYEGQNKRK